MKTFLLLLLPFCITGAMARTAYNKADKVAQAGLEGSMAHRAYR